MKKAHDKIFMPNELLSEEWQRHIEGEDTEYIRKDAILEWVEETEKSRMRVPIEAYNNEDYQAGFIDGFAKFRRILIDKINSL